jgi:hypothetical protein
VRLRLSLTDSVIAVVGERADIAAGRLCWKPSTPGTSG